MSPAWAIIIVIVAAGVAIAAMLFVRRNAPEGSYFADGDRAAGVFGVIATGFSVLLGLIVFLAFESYDQSRVGAEEEARLVAQQFETAQFLPAAVRRELGHELVCYARFVVNEWPRLESANDDTVDTVNPWAVALFRTLKVTNPRTVAEQTAYDKWLDRTADREEARDDRIHGAVGVIPGTLWIVLLFITGAIFVFMLFFADSGERAVTQALMMGSVIAVITATLLLIRFLDDPFRDGYGGLKPVAMERTLRLLDQQRRIVGDRGAVAMRRGRKTAAGRSRSMSAASHERQEAHPCRAHGAGCDGPARARRPGHRLVELPGIALARRAGGGAEPSPRQSASSRRAPPVSRTGRARSTSSSSSSGSMRARRATPSWPPSTAPASPTGSSRRSGPGSHGSL